MLTALDETHIDGVKTTIPVHKKLLARPEFAAVTHHSKFIEAASDLLEAK
jgi:acetyl-CoA carboxylase biotin carboxylase subunit